MKKAFTLIELLVVIAIIAILAAILFPVFAQAKAAAKKTASLSNTKQMGTGLLVYLSDSDDNMPSALWQGYCVAPTPITDFVGGTTPSVSTDQANSYWGTAMQPYIKSWPLYKDTAMKNLNPSTYPDTIKKYTYGFNGYLHLYNATAVASPSLAVMFWPSFGASQLMGYAHSMPQLDNKTSGFPTASTEGTARFSNSGSDCTVAAYVTLGTANPLTVDNRMYGDTSLMTYVDGHAKSVSTKSNLFPYKLNTTTGAFSSWYQNATDAANGCSYFAVLAPTIQ